MAKTCGICGKSFRFVGSHVLRDHLPISATPEQVTAALAKARVTK